MTEHDDLSSVDDMLLARAAESEDPSGGESGGGVPAVPDSGKSAKIQQLIRDKQLAESLAARSAVEAAALRNSAQQVGNPQEYRAPEEYTRAVAQQAVREAGAEMLARQAMQAREAANRVAQEAWAETTAGFRQRVPDFDAVAHNPNLPVTPVMADAIRESARGAEIAYYLGKNPAEAARISRLAPVSQATAIARLEARVASHTVAVSRAPQPISTVSGRSGGSGRSLEDMPFEDYRRARGY